MKQITVNTKLIQGDKTYSAVEADKVIYWGKKSSEDWFNFYRGQEYWVFVAQSKPILDGVPVISLNDYWIYKWEELNNVLKGVGGVNPYSFEKGFKSNPNKYTQKDIEKAIELAKMKTELEGGVIVRKYSKKQILEKINSVSTITIDSSFNIIAYE